MPSKKAKHYGPWPAPDATPIIRLDGEPMTEDLLKWLPEAGAWHCVRCNKTCGDCVSNPHWTCDQHDKQHRSYCENVYGNHYLTTLNTDHDSWAYNRYWAEDRVCSKGTAIGALVLQTSQAPRGHVLSTSPVSSNPNPNSAARWAAMVLRTSEGWQTLIRTPRGNSG